MDELPLKVNALYKAEMEYHGKFGHTLGRIQQISLMSRIEILYATCCLSNHTIAPNLPGFQGIKSRVQYMDSHLHKPIFYPSNYCGGSNVIIITWSGNKVEDNTKENCLECHQYTDHYRTLNIRRSVSGILRALLGFSVCCKLYIRPDISSESTDGEII